MLNTFVITFYNVLHCFTMRNKCFTLYYDCITFAVRLRLLCNLLKIQSF
ncbi:hypothetical protein HMPREF1584_01477 [Gardnerella vaginalis JCP8481A]|nr:hypothetical protein HMPREF1584_01477 [Gardnerella vaginalis JCP8481A]EPI40784.1 hypothetical protein HMPREF1585_01443 [Gardnerella vaginalis JCP8481B]